MHIICTIHAPNPCRSQRPPQGRLRHHSGSRRSKRDGRATSGPVDPRLGIVTRRSSQWCFSLLDQAKHRRCFELSGMVIAAAGSFRFHVARARSGSPHFQSIGVRILSAGAGCLGAVGAERVEHVRLVQELRQWRDGDGGVAVGEDDLLAQLAVPGPVAARQALVEIEREVVGFDEGAQLAACRCRRSW